MTKTTATSVGGTLIVVIQHFGQDHHTTTTKAKSMDQGKKNGQYIHTGDSVGVVMGTAKGELSFVVNDANLDVVFDGIPLDKPLVPCVLLGEERGSVELDTTEVKEKRIVK